MENMQDSVLCPGSIPGSPITGVFVAVVRRSVTNNNNFNKVIVQLSKHWASQCVVKNRNSAGRRVVTACISEKKER